MLSRRRMMQLGTLGAIGLFGFLPSIAQSKTLVKSDNFELLSISDGHLSLPINFLFPNVPADQVVEMLGGDVHDSKTVKSGLNVSVMKSGNRVILFDVGSGTNFFPSAGTFSAELENAGITSDQVTDIVFTHGHPDHLWGILDDFDELAFPEATLHISQTEFDFWMDSQTLLKMPENRQSFAVGAKNRLQAVADRIVTFKTGAEILPGVEAFDSKGHTPGHTSYIIHTDDDPIMIIGDAVTNHIISFQKPDWPSGSDFDTEVGITTRKKVLDRLAGDNMRFVGYHLPNNGFGRAKKTAAGYRFIKA